MLRTLLVFLAGASALALQGGGVEFDVGETKKILAHSPLPPPPPDPTNRWADDPAAARFGQFLFFDERLSGNGAVSCATCHQPDRAWTDGRSLAEAIGKTVRNAPALWNVGHQRWLFWDGRADSLWSQALFPLEDPREHGGSRLQYAHLVAGDPDLRRAYESIFGGLPALDDAARFPAEGRPVPGDPDHPHAAAWASMASEDRAAVDRVFANLGKALAAFQRKIRTRPAPFDVFAEGLREGDPAKQRAISDEAKRGLKLFLGKGRCELCHHGPMFSDLEFHNVLVPPLSEDMPLDTGRRDGLLRVADDPFNGLGPFSDEPDKEARWKVGYLDRRPENLAAVFGAFKTPSLRNVALTAPYMHQGQFESLERVVEYYSTLEGAVQSRGHRERILVPRELTEDEKRALVAFLETLTNGAVDPELTRRPASPVPE